MSRFLLRRLTPAAQLQLQLRWGAAHTVAPRRFMSKGTLDPMTGELTALPDINISALEVIPNTKPSTPPPSSTLVFGHTFTIFEGMKAYRQEDGKVTLFRPDMNMKRMNNSAQRIALPTFDGDALLELIKELIRMDKHWIPKEPGHSLYIRPTLIGTQKAIGVCPPTEALLFVICSPVGPYYPKGFKPVALYGTTEYIRAAPGGTGAYKLGVNYAPGVMPQKEAAAKGYVQNLWLHGPEHHLTENPLAKLPENLTVSERPVTMKEVKEASESGALVELFGAGEIGDQPGGQDRIPWGGRAHSDGGGWDGAGVAAYLDGASGEADWEY
ncbi:hypothetical protein C0992_007210 [Termitomyces sp. T32_za158]|nr:hypothetical protein C0992_007210 [Termitomyces sp. T32_za158]